MFKHKHPKLTPGDIVQTTNDYKNFFTNSDVKTYGFCWNIGEVIEDLDSKACINWFGPIPTEQALDKEWFNKIKCKKY